MAKKSETAAMPMAPKMAPRGSLSWYEKDTPHIDGDPPAMGDRFRMTIEGKVTGFRMDEYGGSIDVEAKSAKFERLGTAEEGESLVDMMRSQRKKKG